MKLVSRFAAAALALSFFGVEASAQVAGMPVNYAPAGTGVTIHGGVGRGVNTNSGKLTSAGGGIVIGMPTISFGADLSLFDASGAKDISFGGHVAYGLPLAPGGPVDLSIVAGVGYISQDFAGASITTIMVPAGVTIAFNVPSPSMDVTPWVSPQFRFARVSNGTSVSSSNFGVSGGLSITLPMGFGFQAIGDYDAESKGFLIGGGVHFSISTPGMSGM